MLELLAVSSAVLIGYAYIGFPFVCWLRAKLFPQPFATADITPNVSLVVACHCPAARVNRWIDTVVSFLSAWVSARDRAPSSCSKIRVGRKLRAP